MKVRSFKLAAVWTLTCFIATFVIAATATQPTTAPTTLPAPVAKVYSLDDAGLAAQLNDGVSRLQSGVYKVAKTVFTSASGTFDCTGTVFQGQHGTIMQVNGDNLRLLNATFDSPYPATKTNGQNPKIGVAGVIFNAQNLFLDHARFRNVDTCLSLNPHSHYLFLNQPHFEPLEVRGANIYCGGLDESIERGMVFWWGGYGKSEQEHPIRCSTPGFRGLFMYDVALSATTGKESLAFRLGHMVLLDHCTFTGQYATFLGETTGDIAQCGDVTLQNCTFHGSAVDLRAAGHIRILNNYFEPNQVVASKYYGQEQQIVTGNTGPGYDVVITGNTRYVKTLTPGRPLRTMMDYPMINTPAMNNVDKLWPQQ